MDKNSALDKTARLGYAAKGAVYCILGGLAAAAAFGYGGQTTGRKGAVQAILQAPFGQVLLVLVALGLIAFAIWKFYRAFTGYGKADDKKEGVKRLGAALSGATYFFFGLYSLNLVFNVVGGSGGGDSSSKKTAVAKVLGWTGGEYIIGAVALIIIAKGLYEFYKGFSGKYKRKIDQSELSESEEQIFMRAGRVGYISRGIVLAIIGYFFMRAALESNAGHVEGTDGVFSFLQNTGGAVLMGAVALGLLGYGIFTFILSRYGKLTEL